MKFKEFLYQKFIKKIFKDYLTEDFQDKTEEKFSIKKVVDNHEFLENFCGTDYIYSSSKSKDSKIEKWTYYFKNSKNIFKILSHSVLIAEYYPNGNLKSKVVDKETTEFYYLSGEIEKIILTPKLINNNQKINYIYTFYKSGQLKEAFKTIDDIKSGLYRKFREDNIPVLEAFYNKDGVLEGTLIYYHDNGKLKETIDYYKGYKQGYSKEFYKNGQLKEVNFWNKDNCIKTLIKYYEDGKEK